MVLTVEGALATNSKKTRNSNINIGFYHRIIFLSSSMFSIYFLTFCCLISQLFSSQKKTTFAKNPQIDMINTDPHVIMSLVVHRQTDIINTVYKSREVTL